jgi:hypothetical protein
MLKHLGFTTSPLEHAMYARGHGQSRFLLGVYVDDLIVTGADADEVKRIKKEMMELFNMSDLGLLHFYLGIEAARARGHGGVQPSARADGASHQADQG